MQAPITSSSNTLPNILLSTRALMMARREAMRPKPDMTSIMPPLAPATSKASCALLIFGKIKRNAVKIAEPRAAVATPDNSKIGKGVLRLCRLMVRTALPTVIHIMKSINPITTLPERPPKIFPKLSSRK